MITIDALPIYLDGSDGSIWSSRDTWAEIFTVPGLAGRRFVCVADLIQWLESNGIEVPRLPSECPIEKMVEHSKEHFLTNPEKLCQAENPDLPIATS